MATPVSAKPTGYQEYYVLGYEEHIWRAFDAIYDGSVSENICSTVSLVATADHQVIYYDHWEDGYEADLLNPRQSSTLIFGDGDPSNGGEGADILMAGDKINLTSNQNITATNTITGYVPVNPRDPAYIRYDGGDRIISSGGPINLVHAMWPCDESWVGGAWEVYSRQAYANAYAYTIPIGEDLYQLDSAAYADFKYVYLQVNAFENNTTISIDNRAGYVVNLTLDRGQAYSSMGHLNSTSVPSITINAGAVVRTNKPVQVGLVTGGHSPTEGFQGRFLIILPTQLWGADYVAPVPGGGVKHEAQIYLSNPNNFPIDIDAYHQGAHHTFTIDSTATPISATIPYTNTIGANIPTGSATRFTSPDGVFGVVVCADSGQLAYDWGFAGVPAKYLTQDYYVSWAPGDANIPPENNGSPLWVTPLADGTTFYVDFSPLDGVVDQTFTLDALEQRRIFDPDNDNTGMHVWATGEFAIVWGVDPLTAGPGVPYLDMGVSILPLIQRWLDPVMVLEKNAQPTSLPPAGGVVTFTLTAQAYDAPLDDVSFTDTLPLRWAYVPSSALVTYPDGSTQATDPAIDERKLYWNLGHDLKEKERLTLTFQAELTSTGSVGVPITDGFESGDYTGGQNWASDWYTTGAGIRILSDNPFVGDYHLNIPGDAEYAISRTADLNAFTAPVLSFMQQISTTTDNPFYLDVHDGATWTTALTMTSASISYQQESVDLSAYAGPGTSIRFRSSNSLPSTYLNVDQVEIRDAIAVNVNHGEAIGRHQYADVLFNPYDSASVYVSDLSLEKSVNKFEAQIGDTLVYTLACTNLSEEISLTNVTLSDAIPLQHVKFISASHDGAYAGASGAITWTITDELAPGASVSRTFSVIVNNFVEDGTMINNTAYASSKQTNQVSSNQVRTRVAAPKVLFAKSGPTAINPGQVMTYTLSYENVSSVPATEVVIQDQIPISTTYVPGSLAIITDTEWVSLTDAPGDDIGAYLSPTLVITPGVIPGHSEGRIRFAVQVEEGLSPGSIIHNWATLDRALDIPRESNLSVTRITELLIDKQAETASSARVPRLAVAPGELITYTMIYANVSTTSEQSNVFVREAIPDYTDFVTASTPISYSWNHGATWLPTQPVTPVTHVRWHDPLVPTDTHRSVTLTVRLGETFPPGTTIENIAYISSTQTGAYLPEWIPSNQVEVGTVDLWVNKSANQPSMRAGDPVTYTITYGNQGSVHAYDLQIRDVPPTHTQYIPGSIWGPGADAGTPPTLTWQIEMLAPGNSGEAGYVALVDSDVLSGTTTANTAALSHPYGAEIVSAPALITITTSADLALEKRAPATGIAGQSLAYTLTLTNLGPSTARAVTLTDTLPPASAVDFGVDHIVSSDLPTFSVEGQTLTWLTPTLAPGASATVVFTVAVHPDAAETHPQITNTVAVAADTADPQPDNDADEAVTQIGALADLALDKRAPAIGVAGQSLAYTVTLTNLGPSTAHAVTLTDTLPPASAVDFGVDHIVSSDLPTFSVEGQTLTWLTPTLAPGASATVVFTVAVHPDAAETHPQITNTVAVAADTADPQPDNDTDEAVTSISPPGPAVIHGTVFLDANGNGRQDPGEEGLYQVLITLDHTITTTTDVNGHYVFTTTEAGYHTVVETDPTRYIPPGQEPLAVLDVGYFSTTPNKVVVDVELGRAYQINFGDASTRVPFAVIYGTVFQDDNGDGLQGDTEAGLSNVLVSLNHTVTTTTDLYGRYTITTAPGGVQTVREIDPPGYFSSTPNQIQIRIYRGRGYAVNFGDVPSDAEFASIYGVVYDDVNGNGILDADETGIPGVTITMNDTQTSTTSLYGAYTFSTWEPSTHTLVETDPPGYVSTTPNTRHVAVELKRGYRVDFGDVESGDCPPDFYEPDDSPAQASTFVIGTVQSHNFCDDAHDWVKFRTEANLVYTLTTTIWGARADTLLSVFDIDGETLLAYNDDYTTSNASRIVWSAPSANVYYALVENKDGVTGTHTSYTLWITGAAPHQLYLPLVMRNG